MTSKYLPPILALIPALLPALAPASARACAVLSPDSRATLAQEQTIIVWDAQRRTEHFIRRLEFNTGDSRPSENSSIGFLVPTPGVPQLAEVSGQAFTRVQNWMRPREIHRTENRYHFSVLQSRPNQDGFVGAAAPNSSAPGEGVQVLAQQQVGAMQATVLKGGAGEVVRWLKRNGYPTRPSFVRWLQPYARKGWVITAFKFARPKSQQRAWDVRTTTVRLSFAIDQPFYPYREPRHEKNEPQPVRQLALYVFEAGRIEGQAGRNAWKVAPEWSQAVSGQADLGDLMSDLKLERGVLGSPKSPLWMTAFVDSQATRLDADLQFRLAGSQAPVEPPPTVNTSVRDVYVPLDLAALALLGLGSVAWARRRGKAQEPA